MSCSKISLNNIHTKASRRPKGFTLVEQLVVLTLIVILVGFGAVRMVETNRQNELDHATRGIETVFRFLQMKALQDGLVYQLAVSSDKRQLHIKRQNEEGRGFEPVKSSLIRSFRLGESLSLESERGGEILFYPDGSSSKNRLILLKESGRERMLFRLKNRIGTVEVSRA